MVCFFTDGWTHQGYSESIGMSRSELILAQGKTGHGKRKRETGSGKRERGEGLSCL